MKWFKRILKAFAALIALVLVVALALFIYVQVKYNVDFPSTPMPQITARTDAETIARGEYIVHAVAHCSTCHGPADLVKQHLLDTKKPLVGGNRWEAGMFGTFIARNLTPDVETGIGKLTDGQIARTIRHGVDSRGKLSPFMRIGVGPMSDEDLTAVISYLRAQTPVEAKRPYYELGFIGKVVMLDFGPRMTPPPAHVPEGQVSVERGKYLAEGPAACVMCHTPRDALDGFAPAGPLFSGENEAAEDELHPGQEIIPPNLTPDPTTGHITSWTEEMFVARFRAGRVVQGSIMPWDAYQRMTDSDLRSLYRFLRSLPPTKHHVGPTVRPS
jgi:mono/diheme cytochrome c family protein